MPNYNLPIYTGLNRTTSGQVFSEQIKEERVYVYNSMGVLYGMPDRRHRVYISGMSEVDWHSKIENKSQYKVDYEHTGTIFFHPEFDSSSIMVRSYYSRGLQYFPASRIWTKIDGLGNVIQTLDDVITLLEDMEFNEKELKELVEYSNNVINEGNKLVIDMQSNIKESKRMKDLLEILMLQSGGAIKVMEELLERGDELSEQLSDLAIMYENVLEVTDKLEKLNADAVETTLKLEEQFDVGVGLQQMLEEFLPKAKKVTDSLIVATTTGDETLHQLIEQTGLGESVLAKLLRAIESGSLLHKSLEDVNSITQELISESLIINKETAQIIESAKTAKEALLPIVKRGEDIHPKLEDAIKRAEDINLELIATIDKGKAITTQAEQSIERCEIALNNLLEAEQEVKIVQESLDSTILSGDSLLSSLTKEIEDGKVVLEKLKEIIEGTDYETILESINKLNDEKQNKKDVLITFTQENEPTMKVGDQWHKIID